MKAAYNLLLALTCSSLLLNAKESPKIIEAIRKYRAHEPVENRVAMSDEDIKTEIAALINIKNYQESFERILGILEVVRDKTEKNQNLINPLKELWKSHHPRTFRSTYPDSWSSVRGLDCAQVICDEIKTLVISLGGNLDDIEPISERNTHDLENIWKSLIGVKDGSPDKPLGRAELQAMSEKLSAIIIRCTFAAGSRDENLQLYFIHQIIRLLGDREVWPDQKLIGKDDPIISFYDVTLSKSLPLIDEKWVQKPTGNKGPNQVEPSAEQKAEWRKNSLVGSQQAVLRNIRDEIIINASNLISLKKEDAAFKQAMLDRFGKNDALRKSIESCVSSNE